MVCVYFFKCLSVYKVYTMQSVFFPFYSYSIEIIVELLLIVVFLHSAVLCTQNTVIYVS